MDRADWKLTLAIIGWEIMMIVIAFCAGVLGQLFLGSPIGFVITCVLLRFLPRLDE